MLTDLIGEITQAIEVTTETDTGGMSLLEVIVVDTQKETIMITEIIGLHLIQVFNKTRTTNVVRNAGCTRSRYTLKLSLIFFNHLINESNQLI